jgi:hypothetical protein
VVSAESRADSSRPDAHTGMDALVEAHLVVVPGTYRAALVVSSTALMLGYRTRPVFVPAARPNDPMAPYRTRVMRRSRLFGGASRLQLMCCAVFVLRSSTRSRRWAASSTWRWWTAPSPRTRAHRCPVPGRPTLTPSRSPPVL